MTWRHRHSAATRTLRRHGVAWVAAALLAAGLLGAPAALGALPGDLSLTVPEAGPVPEAPSISLPSPPDPVAPPVVPEPPAQLPLPQAPKPAPPAAPAPGAGLPTVHEAADGLGKAVGAVTGVPSEAVGASAVEKPSSGAGGLVAATPRSQPRVSILAQNPSGSSVGSAEAAPPPRLLAYVWPAIALSFAAPLVSLLDRWGEDVGGVLLDASGLLPRLLAVASAVGLNPPPGQTGVAGRADQSPPGLHLPDGGLSLLMALSMGLLIAVGLVALARLLVGEELFEPRRWRSHRGL